MTVAEIALLIILYQLMNIDRWLEGQYSMLKTLVLIPFFSMPLFAQLDAHSRYQNYKQLKDQLYRFGFRERIMKPVLKSRCQRDAAIAAADELGIKELCRSYFFDAGYRWYHLLPDFFFKKPQFLFSWYFWKSTFFVRQYRPIYDFKLLNASTNGVIRYVADQ